MARRSKYHPYILLTLAILVGALGTSIRFAAISHSPLHNAKTISFTATVKSDPVVGRKRVVGSHLRGGSTTFLATLDHGAIDGKEYSLHLPVRISSTKSVNFLPGTHISGSGTVFATSERRVAALISTRSTLVQIGSTDPINAISGEIRRSFKASALTIGGASGALIPGLVLGDTSLEKAQFVEDMRRSGLTHLTAVSGENFAIIAAFILWALAFFVRSMRIRILITASILIAFIFLVRPSPSVMRASVMTAVLLVGKIKGERGSALPALGLAIGLLVLLDPFQAIDPGFALSVSATAGILIASDPIALYLSRFIGQSKIVEMLAIPIAATLFCTPLIMAISGQLSLVSLPANLLASEVVAPITIIGFIAALASPIIPGLSHLLLLLCKPFSAWIVFIAHALGSLPVLKVPKSFLGAAIALIAIILIIRKLWKLIAIITITVVAVHFGISMGWPGSHWLYVNCDVGQGDGAVINLGGGSAIVIDVGPDPVAMDSCLSALHIKTIALLVLTHYHADHVNGLSGAMHGREVESVWVTNNPEPALEFAQIRELLQSHLLTVVHQGQKSEFNSQLGKVKILVLWPRIEVEKLPSLPGDGSGINNSSIALLISIGKFSLYTSGDTEPPAQQAITESGLIHAVDLMKVSHHGSAYQYTPLLDLLRPKVAIISVGAGNTYGHPAQATIAALEQRGVRVLRTDLDGAIALDQDLRISTQKRKWWDISWG